MSSVLPALAEADDASLGALGGGRWRADAAMTRVHGISPSLVALLGFDADRWHEEAGLWYARLHPLDRDAVLRRRLDRRDHVVDYRFLAADGRTLWLREAVRFDGDALESIVLDVTATRKSDAAATARLAALVESSRDAICATTLTGLITDWNEAAARLFGYRAEEVVGRPVTVLLSPARLAAETELLARAAAGERVEPFETELVRNGGRRVPAWVSLSPIREAGGSTIGVSAIVRDLSETLQAQRELREGREALARAQALAHLGSWSWDLASGRIDASDEQCRIHGLEPGAPLDFDAFLALVHPQDRQLVAATFQDLLHAQVGDGHVAELAYRIVRTDGHVRWVDARAQIERSRDGRPRRMLATCLDITVVRAAERALQERAEELAHLTERLSRSNRELDQFAYVASHDLKAPLRGIANLSRWIEEDAGGQLSAEAREHLELLRGRVHRMEALIDAILEYSRIGRAGTPSEEVDVGRMVAEVIDLIAPPAGFTVRVEGPLPTLVTKRARLQQVLLNLVGNAIKHHDKPRGEIVVSAQDEGAFWRFRVQDDGPGISPRFHEKIFLIFQTLEPRDKVEGTGIGLALVKKIVESYGGELGVESDVGQGATFHFTWPKRQTQESTE